MTRKDVSIRTQQFLRSIARRLSGRSDLKNANYVIGIGYPADKTRRKYKMDDESERIYFSPDVYCFRDMHHRSDKDKFRVADLILHKQFPELVKGRDEYGELVVDISKLNTGVYEYQSSFDVKRRRWVRIR